MERLRARLMTKIREAAPNARDFVPQGADAYRKAMAEHLAQLATVDEMRRHYNEILEGIQAQPDARRR